MAAKGGISFAVSSDGSVFTCTASENGWGDRTSFSRAAEKAGATWNANTAASTVASRTAPRRRGLVESGSRANCRRFTRNLKR
jgi:hypothetical protein